MFYAHIVLAKKGPLARIWLAAHWDKKLTKAHVFETNIEQSVEGIMQPKVKLALRTSGHLLLGVVRIYSRKAKYLLADCNEAFVKIKMAFRPGMVDLPEEHREAAVNAITLPEVFHDFDTALPELNDVDIEAQFSINQSRADEITMREDYGSLSMSIHDDGFGDMGFDADTHELVREGIDPNIDENLFAEELGKEIDQTKEPVPGTSRTMLDDDLHDAHLADDGFGEEFGQPAAGLFEGDIFSEAPLPQPESTALPPVPDDDMDHFDAGPPSPMPSSIGSRPPSALDQAGAFSERRAPSVPSGQLTPAAIDAIVANDVIIPPEGEPTAVTVTDQTTLLNNEEESFALAPVDASAYKGITKAKRKRKLIVDEIKNISGEEMKSQLANTSDIVTTLDLAPPTKRLMYWKETGGVEKLFALPSRDIPARFLFKNYQRHLSSRAFGIEDFSVLGAAELLALEQAQELESPTTTRRGRKRKLPPIDTQPFETATIETHPIDALPVGSLPIESLPIESLPIENLPIETLPIETHPIEAQPLEIPPLEAQPLETQSLENTLVSELEPIREGDLQDRVTGVSLDMGISGNETLMPPPPIPDFDPMRSPAQYPMLHISGLGPMTPSLPNIAMTPGSLSHGIDIHDDFHHSGLTPAGLQHGGVTPRHPEIEGIESMPNLPADQVSSILDAAAGVGGNEITGLGYEDLGFEPAQPAAHDSSKNSRDLGGPLEEIEFPVTVGDHQPGDEQMENETDEQFEERVLNKRAAQMFVAVRHRLQKREGMYLSEMTTRNNRKQAAQKFYSLLVLKKFRALEITQNEPYGDILVTKGPMFDNPKL